MIANVSKNNTGKLLVAVLAMFMIVAGATIAFSDNVKAADVDYGSSVDIDQDAIGALVKDGVIAVSTPTTWKLTGNVTLTDVSIQLSSNLKITSAADDNFSLRVTYNGDAADSNTDVTAAVLGVPSEKTANLAIENTTVMFNNTTVNASWTINSSAENTQLNVDIVNSDVTFSKTAENTGGNGALWRTGSGNTIITSDKDSTITFTSNGQGVQGLLIVADGTTIQNDLGEATLAIYADFKDVTLSGGNIGLYAANLVNSTIETAGNVGVYSGKAESAFDENDKLTTNTVVVDDESAISAGAIVNDISSAGTTAGSDIITFSGKGTVSGDFSDVGATNSAKYTLSGVTLTGNNNVSDKVSVDGTYTLGAGSSLNVAKGATLGGTVTNNGSIVAADSGSISDLTLAAGGTGSITGSGTENAELGGIINPSASGTVFGPTQVVEVVSNLTIKSGAVVIINGVLNVASDKTITIEDGGQLVITGVGATLNNEGTIISQSVAASTYDGGLVIDKNTILNNTGSIQASYTGTGASQGQAVIRLAGTVNNDGEIVANAGQYNNIALLGVINNNADGSISVVGAVNISTGKIVNYGLMTINGYVRMYGDAVIALASADASVVITSITTDKADGKSLKVDNSALTTGVSGEEFDNVVSGIAVTPIKDYVFSGLTVTASSATEGTGDKIQYLRYLNIDGTIANTPSVAVDDKDKKSVELTTSGEDVVANGTFNVGKDIVIKGTALSISGNANIAGDQIEVTELTVTGTLVTGTLTLTKVTTINAVHYTVTTSENVTNNYYSTLANAVDAGAKLITVHGTVEVDTEVTVPSGTTVNMSGTLLTITEEGFVTIADGAKLNVSAGTVEVEGSLYVEVEKTGLVIASSAKVESEVKSTDGTDVLYTNLAYAMEKAQSGDTIQLNGQVDIDSPFTIKEGVTVDTNKNNFNVNSDLTIDGTLYLNGGNYVVDDEEGNVALNGYIKSKSAMSYNAEKNEYPAGAYYRATVENVNYYFISTPANAAAIINEIVNQTVDIYGDNKVGDISFEGTATAPATINVIGTVTGNVEISNAVINVKNGGSVSGSVADANGKVTVSGASYSSAAFTANADGLTVQGYLTQAADSDLSFQVDGTVNATGLTVPEMTVAGTLNVIGTVNIGEALTIDGTVYVSARLYVTNNDLDANLVVNGTLDAAVEGKTAGTVTADNLYVGLDKEDVDNGVVGGAGDVNGKVSATKSYVSNGSTVPKSITDETVADSTAFYVDDVLWMTIYGKGDVTISKAPVENVWFKGWVDPTNTNAEPSTKVTLSAQDRVDAVVKTDVYNITVYTDGGIGSVAIDGVILQKGTNTFNTVNPIDAGEHKLDCTLAAGFQGEPVITIDGQALAGNTFTLSGTPTSEDGIDIVIYVSGTSPSDSTIVIEGGNGDDGLGLTDILLIVLVVLIVIMAIIVALRLMRS